VTTRAAPAACRLGPAHAERLADLLDGDRVGNAYLRSELRLGIDGGEWWGAFDGSELVATVLAGPLAWPYIPHAQDAASLADALAGTAEPRMLVGPRPSVLALHRAFMPPRYAREQRDPQPLLALDRASLLPLPPAPVHRATHADLDGLVLASAAMHHEEMGSDPLAGDAAGWRARMAGLIARGWSWVWTEAGHIVFKAELSAWNPDVVQIQGVYTAPQHRRRGLASLGLATICSALLEEVSLCTLYVNNYNAAALRVYRRLGFRDAGAFSTVFY
jgi:ribosomal protein S18 acetylase RimI-like enzyme